MEEDKIECYDCGTLVVEEDTYKTYDGDCICEECFKESYFECPDCGYIYHNDDGNFDPNEMYICHDCFHENYFTCYQCDGIFHNDDCYYHDDKPLCEDCYNECVSNNNIHNYDYTPEFVFHNTDPKLANPLYLGFELEIDGEFERDDLCEVLRSYDPNCNLFYFKNDGSLSEAGFEIVTMPSTLEFYKKEFPLEKIVTACRNAGATSHDAGNCGLHIHIGKNYFSNYELSATKIVYLFERFWEYLVPFSRRKTFNYCYKNEETGKINVEKIRNIKYKTTEKGRYQAVNLIPYNTIEIRLWRGSLLNETILASLEMTQLLAELAETKSILEMQKLTWEKLLEIANNYKYKNIGTYCKRLNLTTNNS